MVGSPNKIFNTLGLQGLHLDLQATGRGVVPLMVLILCHSRLVGIMEVLAALHQVSLWLATLTSVSRVLLLNSMAHLPGL